MPDITSRVRWLDEKLRFLDLRLHRTEGGWLKRFGITRESPGFLLLPPLVCFAIVTGAGTLDLRLAYATVAALVVFFLVKSLGRATSSRSIKWDMAIHVGLIGAVAAIVWLAGGDQYQSNKLYRHLFIPLAWLICASLALAALVVDWFFRDLIDNSKYPTYLTMAELFQSYGPARTSTAGRTLASAVTAPFRGPLQLLWLPSVVALVSLPAWLWRSTIIAGAISFVALVMAGIDDRFDAMWRLFQRAMFRGGALAVSILVIVFAIARIADVSYVTTVLDSAAAQSVLFLLGAFYVLSLWADYWITRLLSQCILSIVAGRAVNNAAIDYPICQSYTSVPVDHRVLQIHGASRFLAVRETDPKDPTNVRFQAHTAESLIELLADSGAPGGKAAPLPSQIRARSNAYLSLVATFLLAVGGLGLWLLHNGDQSAELTATTKTPANVDLNRLLSDESRQKDGHPVIVMAASGGGTRAALFTAGVLRALWRQNAARDVAFASGISGGGAALAYFASERPDLIAATKEDAWDQYLATMQEPFIQDVLTKASEWRMFGSGRIGMLLSESFIDRWHLPGARQTLGSVKDFGLILNTSLAGHFDCKDAKDGSCADPLIYLERRNRKLTRSELAGGRLILTNLKIDPSLAPPAPEGKTSHDLPVVVSDPAIRLETAAALNANFPPVFSDSGVDLDGQTRYWITDGGAIDNRGMETLLYTLRETLADKKSGLPRMIVLIADASGYSPLFSQDRGSAAALAAGSKMASQLSSELVASIQRVYCAANQPNDFGFAYLFMPDELRNSTSFGTHWMLQRRIKVKHDDNDEVTISGGDMVQVLKYLYTDETPAGLSSDAMQVLNWARAAKSPWTDLVHGLKKGGKLPGTAACI